ncbi:hypothetical protein SAMN02745154_00625, partial [Mycoplasmopsis verecunda]
MLIDLKYNKKRVFCIKIEEKVYQTVISKTQREAYYHFAIMDSLNDNEINKIHKDINKLREQNITHFNIEKLAIMFKNFAT